MIKSFKDDNDFVDVSDEDCKIIRRVCEAVSTHAARLAAAGIVALVRKVYFAVLRIHVLLKHVCKPVAFTCATIS